MKLTYEASFDEMCDLLDKLTSYEDYSYLEDLMCWCIGAVGAKHPHINLDVINVSIKRRWYWRVAWWAECYSVIASGDSPIEALESLLLKLMEAE